MTRNRSAHLKYSEAAETWPYISDSVPALPLKTLLPLRSLLPLHNTSFPLFSGWTAQTLHLTDPDSQKLHQYTSTHHHSAPDNYTPLSFSGSPSGSAHYSRIHASVCHSNRTDPPADPQNIPDRPTEEHLRCHRSSSRR